MSKYILSFCHLKFKPISVCITNCQNDTTKYIELFDKNTGLSIYEIERRMKSIVDFVDNKLANGHCFVIVNFKDFLSCFNFNCYPEYLNVYDIPVIGIKKEHLEKINAVLINKELQDWQQIRANASVAYEDLQRRGLKNGGVEVWPHWSLDTKSGRSKCSGFNIQGTTSKDDITNPYGSPSDVFVHFDWSAADIRMASYLSKDEFLTELCSHDDPYEELSNHIGGVTRNECKIILLKTINSMDINSPVLDMFPKLRKWIIDEETKINNGVGSSSILNRKFKGSNVKSVFNSTMQGSIAHAMHISLRKAWEKWGLKIITEVHDSLILTCMSHDNAIKSMVKNIGSIMTRPFSQYLNDDLVLPIEVNIGKKWKQWEKHGNLIWQINQSGSDKTD